MASLRFAATIELQGINPFVRVNGARAEKLAPRWRKAMPVLVKVDGQPEAGWRINMLPAGDGSFYLYLHGSVRAASQTQVGDRVRVELSFDENYRPGPARLPAWFRSALAANATATKAWKALPPSRRKEVVRYLSQLKSEAAHTRNVAKTLRVLTGENSRFMGRSWSRGA